MELTEIVMKNCDQYVNFLYFREVISWVSGLIAVVFIYGIFRILKKKWDQDFN